MSNPGGALSRATIKENTEAVKKAKAPPKPQAAPTVTGWTIFDRPLADARAALQERPSEATGSAENDNDAGAVDGNDLEDNDGDDNQPETRVQPNLLIDHKVPKRKENRRGRPIVKLLDKMLQPCHHVNHPSREIQRCSGNNCGTTFANRNTNRAAKHVRNCISCPAALRKVFCVCGIPTSVASHDAWQDIFRIGVRGYKAADRNKLEDEQIISEAERIRQLQVDYLRTQENITVSCDGGTARNHDAYWTVHMSTMDRIVYLMETREATNVSHTGEWIVQLVLEVSSDT